MCFQSRTCNFLGTFVFLVLFFFITSSKSLHMYYVIYYAFDRQKSQMSHTFLPTNRVLNSGPPTDSTVQWTTGWRVHLRNHTGPRAVFRLHSQCQEKLCCIQIGTWIAACLVQNMKYCNVMGSISVYLDRPLKFLIRILCPCFRSQGPKERKTVLFSNLPITPITNMCFVLFCF